MQVPVGFTALAACSAPIFTRALIEAATSRHAGSA
jgi:hypothetical protein